MASKVYKKRSLELIQATDLAIEAFEKIPPDDFSPDHVISVTNTYRDMKRMIEEAEKHFQNMESLGYQEEAVFTYFQEGHGKCVDEFWKMIKAADLPFQRENKLKKIMKRKAIKDRIEYDFVIDVLLPYQEDGLIGPAEVKLLNQWISDFEQNRL